MNLKEQANALKDKIPSVYEAGKKAESDDFWGRIAEVSNLYYAFAGYVWSHIAKDKLKPIRDIKPTNANGIFAYWNSGKRINFKEHFDNLGKKLDFSNCTNIGAAFNQSTIITGLGIIDARKTTSLQATFYSMSNLESIEKFMPPTSDSVTYGNTFNGCSALKDIVIEGEILNTVTFQNSSKLTKDSIISIVSSLGEGVTGKTLTLSNTAVTNAFGSTDSDEWKALRATKPNWTISFA